MSEPTTDPNRANPRAAFVTTRWSMVLAAGLDSPVASEQALSWLCRTYQYPPYAFLHRQGRSVGQARIFKALLDHLLGGENPATNASGVERFGKIRDVQQNKQRETKAST